MRTGTSPLDSSSFSPLQGQASFHFFHFPYDDSANMMQEVLHCTSSCGCNGIQFYAGGFALHEATLMSWIRLDGDCG